LGRFRAFEQVEIPRKFIGTKIAIAIENRDVRSGKFRFFRELDGVATLLMNDKNLIGKKQDLC